MRARLLRVLQADISKYILNMAQKFSSHVNFVFASIGAAVGLGNALRFPGLCAKYGGGAFLLVYSVSLVCLGLPLLTSEIALGRKYGGGAPKCFGSLFPRAEKVGWACSFNSLAVAVIYVGLVGWLICAGVKMPSLCASAPRRTQAEISGWFFGEALGGKFSLIVAAALAAVWAAVYFLLRGGADTLSRAAKYTVTLPVAMLVFMACRGMFYPRAGAALRALFVPDFSALATAELWVNALGQVFFSLSVLAGIMPAYGAYLPKGARVARDGAVIAAADLGVSVLSSVVAFTTLYGCGLQGAAEQGGAIASFSVYPVAISRAFGEGATAANAVLGVLFYFSLALMAVQSAVSMIEAALNPIADKFSADRKRAALKICIVGFAVTCVFASGYGKCALDIADHFANYFDILILAVAECIVLSAGMDRANLAFEINRYCGFFRIPPAALKISLKALCPAVASALCVVALCSYIFKEKFLYGGYPLWAQMVFGLSVSVFTFSAGFFVNLFYRVKNSPPRRLKKI